MANDLIITGYERALLGFRDTTGGFTGQQSTLANAATSGAYVIDLPRTASYEALAPVNLNIEGGDVIFTTIQFGNSKTNPFDMIISDYDQTLVELLSGSTSNTANTFSTVVSDNPARATPRIVALGLQSRANDKNTGAGFYVTHWFPACAVRIKRKGPAYQAQSDIVISCTPMMANKDIHGRGFGSVAPGLNMTLVGDKTDNYDFVSNNPIHVTSARQDGIITSFTTFYRPLSTVITLNATPNLFTIGATPTALSAFNTTTGVATLVAAGSAAALDVVSYETAYVPV
jgi:hypothetical protein